MTSCKSCATVGFGVISFLVFVIGFSSPYWEWIKSSVEPGWRTTEYNTGLWVYCFVRFGITECVTRVFSDGPGGFPLLSASGASVTTIALFLADWMQGIQACAVLALGFSFSAVVTAIIWSCKPKTKVLMWLTAAFFLVAGKPSQKLGDDRYNTGNQIVTHSI